MDRKYCLSVGKIVSSSINKMTLINVNSFSIAKQVVLRHGMPEVVTCSLDFEGDSFDSFLKWLMYDMWDVNIGPNVPDFFFIDGTSEQLEKANNLIAGWKAYAR